MKKCKDCGELKPLTKYYKHPNYKDGYYNSCKKCYDLKTTTQKSQLIPYLRKAYRSVTYRKNNTSVVKGRKKNRFKLAEARHECEITWEEFLEKFNDQHKFLGLTCPISGVQMTHQLGKGKLDTNLSADRLDNDLPYTYNNLIFMSYGANLTKGHIRFPDVIALNFWLKEFMPHKYYGYTKEFELRLRKLYKQAEIKEKQNEMEQAIQLSEEREGTDWEQTSLFD